MKKSLKRACLLVLPVVLVACNDHSSEQHAEESRGINLHYMDTTVSPKEDFYNYVNGTWMKETEIPEDRTSWGGFGVLRKDTDNDVLEIMKKASESGKYASDTDQAKALDVFNSYLDSTAREKAGITPLQPYLDEIKNIQNYADLQRVLGKESVVVGNPFFGLAAFSDPSDSNMNATYITTGSLGLPDRDYYIKNDEATKKIRKEYVAHITRMLQFLGETEEVAKAKAEKILAMETQLAEPRLDKVQSRDFRNFNNPKSIAELQKLTPTINWENYMKDLGVTKQVDTVLVMQPKYMEALQKFLTKNSLQDIKDLVTWSTFNSAADELTPEIDRANWDFYSKTLNGAKKQRPVEERALAVVNGSIGEAVGQLYVDEKFPPEAKAKAEKMIANIIEAYKARIQKLDWMSEETKKKAIEKLDKFTVKIGYPDKWEDYSKMAVSADKGYFENMKAVGAWKLQDNLSKIGEPVDKSKWGMSPQTVNAYFNPFFNEIVFPAAILQPPFYDYKADEAVNYGGIGAVIGHEISHAFDDSGARFDADGNLNNWWTEEDLEKFTERGNKLADQYSKIEVLDSVYINGKFTLGENIGDLGGVLGAYDGLQRYYKENGRPDKIDGFTPEQRFFMSWATVWRTKIRDEALRSRIATDPHSPGMYRAYVPLQNVDAFYDAFDIKEGDKMYISPEERVRIW